MCRIIFEDRRDSIELQTWLVSGDFVDDTVHRNLKISFDVAPLKMSFADDSLRRQSSVCPLDSPLPFCKPCWVRRCGEQGQLFLVRPISDPAQRHKTRPFFALPLSLQHLRMLLPTFSVDELGTTTDDRSQIQFPVEH
ncbi:hypothetical protein MTO96_015770 [Rhipicephalus appendiculatus]